MMEHLGNYSKKFITEIPADLNTDEAKKYGQSLRRYPMEGVYVYSFVKNRMMYASGWEEIVGIPDNEINMLAIVNLTQEKFVPFVNEINDKALHFLHARNERLEEYSFNIELKINHVNGRAVPVKAKVSVLETNEGGELNSILGRFQVDNSLHFSNIIRFSAYGPEKDFFESALNEELFFKNYVSRKELEVIELLAGGYAYKEIADKLDISQSTVDKRIQNLFRRFDLKNTTHLIAFAFKNNLI